MVIREYLVENFGFDDSQLKTLGMGKQTGTKPGDEWGMIQILLYPTGVTIPLAGDLPAPVAELIDTNAPAKPTEPVAKKP